MPTVRDQVAFMAHMVALGPILDHQIADFAFGNRWHRPLAWQFRGLRPRWVYRAYPVLSDRIYLPYARSHGLFRRAAHWTVARMTNALLPRAADPGRAQLPEDYPNESLPKWTKARWWEGSGVVHRAYWAALDIELAYPSVQLDRLGQAMNRALKHRVDVEHLFDACPGPVLEALDCVQVRVELGRRLMRALNQIEVDSGSIPRDAWAPPEDHPLPRIQDQPYKGIPTGLAISGMLLNVALLEADREIARYLARTSGNQRGAILRFADDMYVLSRSSRGLFALIEAVHGALSGNGMSSLAVSNEESNICLNFRKIRPDPVRDVIREYLLEQSWTECEICKQPLPDPLVLSATTSLSDWWEFKASTGEAKKHREFLVRTSIERGDIGPFVTSLVERLSDMGTDTLRERFDDGARDHLARLHELARFDIEDEQVRPDTRRTFSVNRLVRAWLPTGREAGEEQRHLRQIRETIGFVLDRTPWKFVLWRAVVRAAARRPLGESEDDPAVDKEAASWLSNLLRRIACDGGRRRSASWLNAWPDKDAIDEHDDERTDGWQDLYLSFLRAAFWRSFAEVIRELKEHASRIEGEETGPWIPSPDLWTSRAVPEGTHDEVAASLGQIEKWVDVLYPAKRSAELDVWPWELDELVGAVLAVHSTTELADAWQTTLGRGPTVQVPATRRIQRMRNLHRLLTRLDRLRPEGSKDNPNLGFRSLAHVQMGHWHEALGDVLFPTDGPSPIQMTADDPRGAIAAGIALGCFEWIDPDLALRVIPSPDERSAAFERDPFLLHDYVGARKLAIGRTVDRVKLPTVHRLLWGAPSDSGLAEWDMAVWEAPAEGLPSRVAAALLTVVRRKEPPKRWNPQQGPLTWTLVDRQGVLAEGRRSQLGLGEPKKTEKSAVAVGRSTAWEVLPNAAFFLPILAANEDEMDCESYVLFCDMLLLLTVLDGSERILDRLVKSGVSGTPLEERWSWRSRIHLPGEAWQSIEKVLRWSDSPWEDVTEIEDKLLESLAGWSSDDVSWEDFLPERIDIALSSDLDAEIVRAITLAGELEEPNLPRDLRVSTSSIADELVVRVGQVLEWPRPQDVVTLFPKIPPVTANAMIRQVRDVFSAPSSVGDNVRPDLVVLPELAIPQSEIRNLHRLVLRTATAVVAGLYWRELKPPFASPRGFTRSRVYFVNEAELVVPVGRGRGPRAVRSYRVRKPLPAHIENGLAHALSNNASGTTWQMLPGRQWYRFVHPEWGDFTVAICADLIDAAPWRALRGDLLHLLMVAFNRDVDLFDSLTWVRAYENYVNVASVNHGKYGGSFLWTPKGRPVRELARLRGGELLLTADVRLPIKGLLSAQNSGVKKAIKDSSRRWRQKKTVPSEFKSPPPGFRRNPGTVKK